MIEFRDHHPVAEEALAAFEAELGVDLPAEYRTWLREVGGRRTAEDYGVRNAVIGQFFTLDARRDFDLQSQQARRDTGFAAWIPLEYLIIAPGAGANICLKLTEPDQGSVWYADFDRGLDVAPDTGGDDRYGGPLPEIMLKLSETLHEFLAGFPEEDGLAVE